MKYTIETFLQAKTSTEWLKEAINNIPMLLVDHAHCEKKAAATALGMIYRYCDKPILLAKMSRLAREELRHFEQVLNIIAQRGERFYHVPPGHYATTLHKHITPHEPIKLIDSLILGAVIEARSCERFGLLVEHLPKDLANFYRKLYLAEARHFESYLELAHHFAGGKNIDDRISHFGAVEAKLILQSDHVFRFHSGDPSLAQSNSISSEPSLIKSPI